MWNAFVCMAGKENLCMMVLNQKSQVLTQW